VIDFIAAIHFTDRGINRLLFYFFFAKTPFMGTLQLQQQQEILRMQHGVGMGGINGRQASVLRSCHSPAIGGTGTSSSGAGSSNHLYLNGGGGAAGNNWSNVYRPQPCGR